ncbi:hypothetical protein JCM6882_008247 [Rhodosporidiobolus microsporus]
MAAVYSKGLPQPVHRLAQGSQHSIHREFASPSTSAPAAASAFRSDASSSSRPHQDDFGSFASPSASHSATSPALTGAFNDAWSSSRFAGAATPSAIASSRNASSDGAEVAAFLNDATVSMFDAIDGHWERELEEKQAEPWRREMEQTMPADPFASDAARAARDAMGDDVKGKGRAVGTKGDMSPTSSELLSSLSSLDLSSRAYLRTLVSLPPDLALEDYLAHGLYTDDVHGLPDGVRRLFEKAAAQTEGNDAAVEEGRMKAVRRLGMVMQHLRASEAADLSQSTERMSLEDVGGTYSTKWRQHSGLSDAVASHAPMNQNEAVFGSSAFAQASAHQQQHSHAAATAFQHAVNQQSQPMLVPSPLSPSAYITMSPSQAAPQPSFVSPASSLTPQPARLASEPPLTAPHDLPSGPLPSFASYFADHHRRMVTNDGGRHGVDFTRSLPVSIAAGVTGAAWREELRVTEGRTH